MFDDDDNDEEASVCICLDHVVLEDDELNDESAM